MSIKNILDSMHPTMFENMCYDILEEVGFNNLQWRTPGADGGRDIEGYTSTIDLSGSTIIEKWYFECKRYTSSLDWPTIYGKLAYADNHEADYLLVITNSSFSTNCLNEVSKHNTKNWPKIRVWPFYKLESLLLIHTPISLKYGLSRDVRDFEKISISATEELSKILQATAARHITGMNIDYELDFALSLSELINQRLNDLRVFGKYSIKKFSKERDSFEWMEINNVIAGSYDKWGIRALMSAIKFVTKSEKIVLEEENDYIKIQPINSKKNIDINKTIKIMLNLGMLKLEDATNPKIKSVVK